MKLLLPFLAFLPLVSLVPLTPPSSPLDYFLPPLVSVYAVNAELSPPVSVPSPDACAAICLAAAARCISFNLCKPNSAVSSSASSSYAPSPYTCSTNTVNAAYRPSTSADCSLFTKIQPRNDTKIAQAVPWTAHSPPPHTVSLRGQLLGDTFQLHRDIYLAVR
jgi:hypothetical protein